MNQAYRKLIPYVVLEPEAREFESYLSNVTKILNSNTDTAHNPQKSWTQNGSRAGQKIELQNPPIFQIVIDTFIGTADVWKI